MFPVQCFSDKNKTRQTFSFQRHKHTTSPDSAINCSPSGHVRLFLSTWDCNDCTASFILPFLIRAQKKKKKAEIWAIRQEYCKEASLCRSRCDADLTWRVCLFCAHTCHCSKMAEATPDPGHNTWGVKLRPSKQCRGNHLWGRRLWQFGAFSKDTIAPHKHLSFVW